MAITQVNLPAVYGAVQQHKTGQMQNQLLQMQMDSAKAAQQKQGALSSLFAEQYGGTDPTSGITWDTGRQGPDAMTDKQFAGRVMALDPQAGMALQDHVAKMTQAQREQWKFEAPLVARAMGNVKDQKSYAAALNSLGNAGVDLSGLPQEYSPENVSSMMAIGQEAESFTLSPGQTRYGAGGTVLASAPAAPAKPGSTIGKLIADRDALPPNDPQRAIYDRAIEAEQQGGGPFGGTGMDAQTMNMLLTGDPTSPEYAAAYNHYAQPKMSYNASGQLITITPDMSAYRPPAGRGGGATQPASGGISFGLDDPSAPALTSGQAPGGGVKIEQVGKPVTSQDERAAAGFATRLESSVKIIDEFESLGAEYLSDIIREWSPNFLKSSERQRLEQAQRDFVNSQLRRESGAVINEEEFVNAAIQYFPQAGDSKETLEQKRQARKIAIQNMRQAAGRETVQDAPKQQKQKQAPGTIPPPPPGYVLVE